MIRRAFAITTAQQYLSMAISFASLVALSRLLTPEEIGTAAVGTAIGLMAIALREFATANFFVQRSYLSSDDVRGGFTVMALLTACICCALAVSAPWFAAALGNPALTPFLRVLCVAFLFELVAQVVLALMQREMAFDRMAVTAIVGHGLGTAFGIVLAALGFGAMSSAWGWLASGVAGAVMAVCLRRDLSIFRLTLRGWLPMLTFGGYNGVTAVLQKAYMQLPYLVLSRTLSMHAAGFYDRALNLAQLPQKMVLGSVFTLMLPVMASEVRAGRGVKAPYLAAVAYITAVQWPALILLVILTHPAVDILLGEQWSGLAPVVQILALAALFAACSELNVATLTSVGGIRDILRCTLIAIPVSGLLLCAAAGFGLKAMALCFFLTIPLHELLMLRAVRRRLGFAWSELGPILRQSAAVTALSASGPLALVAALGFSFDLSVGMAVPVGVLGAVGWLGGLWLTRHPLLGELQRAVAMIGGSRLMARS